MVIVYFGVLSHTPNLSLLILLLLLPLLRMPAVDRDAKVCALAAQLSVPSAPPSSHCQDEPSQRNRLARHRPRKSRQKIKVELGKVKARQQRLAESKTEYDNVRVFLTEGDRVRRRGCIFE